MEKKLKAEVVYLGNDPDGHDKASLQWQATFDFLTGLLDESENLEEAMEKLEWHHEQARKAEGRDRN